MAKLIFARLCKEIKRDPRGGLYSLIGGFSQLRLPNGPVGFVCVVYWEAGEETFRQSFALRDEAGNILDETPVTECVLTNQGKNISTGFFYASFPGVGQYTIDIYRDGACVESIPLKVVETFQSLKRPLAPFGPALQI